MRRKNSSHGFKASTLLLRALIVCLLITATDAFGAGHVPLDSPLNGHVYRHGDISVLITALPISFLTGYAFTEHERLQIYFGNWLRDFSQLIDIGGLRLLSEPLLRAIISLLAFREFGYATGEFDVTKSRLGCCQPREHIDNPRGYAQDIETGYIGDEELKKLDERLRRQVKDEELEIDQATGMKNYIANEGLNISTSAGYIREQLTQCIKKRREGGEADSQEALIHLGAALHTLEDFAAHSNYVELALRKIGVEDVFCLVGDGCRILPPGPHSDLPHHIDHTDARFVAEAEDKLRNIAVPPLITGTFGELDIYQSLIGEFDDVVASRSRGLLGELSSTLQGASSGLSFLFSTIQGAIALLQVVPGSEGLMTTLGTAMKTSEEVQKEPKGAYHPSTSNLAEGPHALWETMEPIFTFHDQARRFLIEHEDELRVPLLSDAVKRLSELIDELVYRVLAIFVEPSIQAMRETVKASKEAIEAADKNQKHYIDVFAQDSTASDPSHSLLAKDHFSSTLNPLAGLVATVITNSTVQLVVHAWDDASIDIDSQVSIVLEVLHHPYFRREDSFVQGKMMEVVQQWWTSRSTEDQEVLKSQLSKDGVRGNKNNQPLTSTSFCGAEKGPAKFEGCAPKIAQRPRKALLQKVADAAVSTAATVLSSLVTSAIPIARLEATPETIKLQKEALRSAIEALKMAIEQAELSDIPPEKESIGEQQKSCDKLVEMLAYLDKAYPA